MNMNDTQPPSDSNEAKQGSGGDCPSTPCSPSSIYLQWYGDDEPSDFDDGTEPADVTWAQEKVWDHDVRYVRWDLVERLLSDVMRIHADPNDAGHNYCDDDKCQWCEWASELFPENV